MLGGFEKDRRGWIIRRPRPYFVGVDRVAEHEWTRRRMTGVQVRAVFRQAEVAIGLDVPIHGRHDRLTTVRKRERRAPLSLTPPRIIARGSRRRRTLPSSPPWGRRRDQLPLRQDAWRRLPR